jgi:acetyl esterase/lipase
MIHKVVTLKDHYPFLGENNRGANVTLYLPDLMDEMGRGEWKRPCLVICPGGAYGVCSDREAEPVALHFLSQGYNVFVLRYSVAPHRFPSQLIEVAAVIELIHHNAEIWHCDTNRIAIMGFSAGGHLAAHYSTCFDIPEIRQYFPESKPVHASVLCYPVISADPRIAHLGSFQNLLGVVSLTEEQIKEFSCDQRVTDHTPPAFLWHTAEDNVVPVANSLRYATALTEHQISVSIHVYPDGWHGLSTVDDQTNDPLPENICYAADWLDAAKKWLKITLG